MIDASKFRARCAGCAARVPVTDETVNRILTAIAAGEPFVCDGILCDDCRAAIRSEFGADGMRDVETRSAARLVARLAGRGRR